MPREKILEPGRNCWRLEKAERLAFLIDAEAYFAAFRAAVREARRSVCIIGWDLDSRVDLLREEPDDGLPVRLGPFLNSVAQNNRELSIAILLWDFSMIVGMDREWFPIFKLDWQTPENIRLRQDDHHPLGASHHQKIVVIDDSLAFVGGLDLTKERWDTTGHAPDDERRRNADGEHYRPHHDVQLMVSGAAARSLGQLFRERWLGSGGSEITPPPRDLPPPWPGGIEADAENCRIAIARTMPSYLGREEVREVERLYLDAIADARDFIYIENQYLTSPKITAALAARLEEGEGPEILIVLPLVTVGWLSQFTMDALKGRAVKKLREADRHGRLGIYYPHLQGLSGSNTIKIHSKLIIVDDRFLQIGSSNLNNRSLGLDTECDLAFESGDREDLTESIRTFRCRLLAEHLESRPEEIGKISEETGGSLLGLIEKFSGGRRCLKKLEAEISPMAEKWLENGDLLDPEHPIDPDEFFEKIAPERASKKGRLQLTGILVLLFMILGLAAAWRFTPLGDLLDRQSVVTFADQIREDDLAPLYVVLVYLIGGLLVVPITGLITVTVALFGPLTGVAYAIMGSIANASLTYFLGMISGRDFVRKLAGDKVNKVSRRLARRGIVSIAVIRLMPIAPFTLINLIAGASHIGFKDYLLGTLLGMVPGMLAIAGLVDRGTELFTDPDLTGYLSLAAVVLMIGGGFYLLQGWARKEEGVEIKGGKATPGK